MQVRCTTCIGGFRTQFVGSPWCQCTCSGSCSTRNPTANYRKRQISESNWAGKRSEEGDSSSTSSPRVYQSQGEPIDDNWLETYFHPAASWKVGNLPNCSISYCDTESCPDFYNFVVLDNCGKPNVTVLWPINRDSNLAVILPDGTKSVNYQ